ncbi:MAG TPA: hypothetical protein VF245_08665 [Solirubrobacterales bacterium]
MQAGARGRPDTIKTMRLSMAFLSTALLLILAPTSQAATFEQVGTFASNGEEVQLGGVGGMAVNVSGAGGVVPGTFYAATFCCAAVGELRVARFSPAGEFELAWGVTAVEEPPALCGPKVPSKPCTPQANAGSGAGLVDVDVDQATGNVYVFRGQGLGGFAVRIYDPAGSWITRFGPTGSGSTAATPEKIHGSPYPGGIAVNDSGEVYVFDVNFSDSFYHRLMVFKPQAPGDYEHYVYAGQNQDIGAGAGPGNWPMKPIADAAGNVYVGGDGYIEMYDPMQPSVPLCKFTLAIGGITAYTVNRNTGELFYYTYKNKHIHQLSGCHEGKFSEIETPIAVAPERDDLYALAFNPILQHSTTPGVLYGGAPKSTPDSGGKGEPGKTSLGYIFAPVEENFPVINAESVSRVTQTTAELEAEINPKGPETSYVFQYLTGAEYEGGGESFGGAAEAPVGGVVLGGGQIPLDAAVGVAGLMSDTEYRYRVIATSHCASGDPSKVCETVGDVSSFRTFPAESNGLPDDRAYELVSPVEKHGGQVFPADPETSSCGKECKPGFGFQHFPMQSSPDGERIVYEGAPFSPSEGAVIENEYIARRTPSGWATVNLTPPQLLSKGGRGYKLFDADLSEGLLEQIRPSLSPEAPTDFSNLYRQPTDFQAQISPLLTGANSFIHRLPTNGLGSLKLTFAGASADLSRVFFEANDALTSEGGEAGEETNLYEWSEGVLTQVNLTPVTAVPTPGAVLGSGKLLKSGNPNGPVEVFTHAISSDGSRVFWTGADGGTYARIDGLGTLQVPGPGSCKASVTLASRVCFLTASEDGSKVLLSNGQVYEFNEEAGAYEAGPDLTGGNGDFLGIAGQSEDLSHVYFVDTAVLTGEEENDQGAKAQAGKDNLYAWVEGTTAFVATLVAADNSVLGKSILGDWQASPVVRTAEASPGGRFVTFLSKAPLTGFDNFGGGACQVISGELEDGPCIEVFLYDSATSELSCPSCNPSGAHPLGHSFLRTILNVSGSLPQPRYLTDSGRLYFDSQDSLVPADTNGGIEDVYQYEPAEVGNCEREDGCVSLISAGRESVDSNFVAIDESGDDVFFTTRDRLVPDDKDELIDLYDARVGGGFPASPASSDGCQAEACQPAAPPPPKGPPASQSFTGPGNPKPQGCKKGRVKRKGKCVQRPKNKKHNSRTKRASKARGGAK